MPTYDYKCPSGHMTAKRYSITETTPADVGCVECNETAKRIFNAPTIEFKGSGFYATDKKEK